MRLWRGVSQQDLARATGVSLSTLRRIENGAITNPPIRYLTNFAAALNCPLEQICEPEWLAWTAFDARAAAPPAPVGFLFHPKMSRPPADLDE